MRITEENSNFFHEKLLYEENSSAQLSKVVSIMELKKIFSEKENEILLNVEQRENQQVYNQQWYGMRR